MKDVNKRDMRIVRFFIGNKVNGINKEQKIGLFLNKEQKNRIRRKKCLF